MRAVSLGGEDLMSCHAHLRCLSRDASLDLPSDELFECAQGHIPIARQRANGFNAQPLHFLGAAVQVLGQGLKLLSHLVDVLGVDGDGLLFGLSLSGVGHDCPPFASGELDFGRAGARSAILFLLRLQH